MAVCLFARLGALVLALDDDPGGQVGDPYGAVGLVHVLAAGALGPVSVDLQVVVVDLDLGVVGQERSDDHGREGRVATVSLVEGALTDEAVLAPFGLQDPVGVLAADREGGGLDPRLLPGARLEQLDCEAPVGGPALVHAQHHLGPVLGVGAAGPGLERDDGVARVVFAIEESRLLELLELAAKRRERCRDLVVHLAAVQARELARVRVVAEQRPIALEAPRRACVLGRDLRGPALVVPETRRVQFVLELSQPAFERSRVKGTPGPSRAGPRARRAAP